MVKSIISDLQPPRIKMLATLVPRLPTKSTYFVTLALLFLGVILSEQENLMYKKKNVH